MLPARLLKEAAKELQLPVTMLARRILDEAIWQAAWRFHHVVPLYKRKSVYDPMNYRGIHLTSVLSKVVEKVV